MMVGHGTRPIGGHLRVMRSISLCNEASVEAELQCMVINGGYSTVAVVRQRRMGSQEP